MKKEKKRVLVFLRTTRKFPSSSCLEIKYMGFHSWVPLIQWTLEFIHIIYNIYLFYFRHRFSHNLESCDLTVVVFIFKLAYLLENSLSSLFESQSYSCTIFFNSWNINVKSVKQKIMLQIWMSHYQYINVHYCIFHVNILIYPIF